MTAAILCAAGSLIIAVSLLSHVIERIRRERVARITRLVRGS